MNSKKKHIKLVEKIHTPDHLSKNKSKKLDAGRYTNQSPPISRYICTCIYRRAYTDRLHCTKWVQIQLRHQCVASLYWFCLFAFILLLFFIFFKHIYSIFILWVHFSLVLRHLKKMLKTNFSASRVFIISFLQVINVVHFYLLFVILFLVFLDFLLYLGSDRSKI